MKTKIAFLLLACSLKISVLQAQLPQIVLTQFATGLAKPTDIKHAGDPRLFVTEQAGVVKIIDSLGNVKTRPFLDIKSKVRSSGSEQGLLGIAFHPDYKSNGLFYVNYTSVSGGSTLIARYRVSSDPDSADAASEKILLTIAQPYTNHNGGDLQFGPDGYLYIPTGDGGSSGDPGNRAQNKKNLLGKVLRISVDTSSVYSIPTSNPFVNDTAYASEIWALGLRNPWRTSFDRITGDYWIADVGQNVWEEVDFQPAASAGGENYGWRCYEGNVTYNTTGCGPSSGYVFPVAVYSHSGNNGCSITGGYVYRGAQHGNLFGHYLHTDFCSGWIRSTRDSAGQWVTHNLGKFGTNDYSTLGQDIDGELYVGGNSTGKIWRISDTSSCNPVAFISMEDTLHGCGDSLVLKALRGKGLLYQWRKNGVAITGSVSDTLVARTNGSYSVTVTNAQNCTSVSLPVVVMLHPFPPVSFSGLKSSYCTGISQKDSLTGNPPGGIFSGPGILQNVFYADSAGVGIHSVVYTFTDSLGCSSSDTQTVDVMICSGIHEALSPGFLVMPNPASSRVTVQFSNGNFTEGELFLFNIYGQAVHRSILRPENGKITMDLSSQPPGVYGILFRTGSGVYSSKIMISR